MKIVILAGGSGTRLWPMSREKKPKQFQKLVGAKTLFELAIVRARKVVDFKDIFVATNKLYLKEVRALAPQIPLKNIILEPACRDTSACIGLATVIASNKNPEEIISIVYADHLVQKEDEFACKLRAAKKLCEQGKLVIIEVKSLFPNTNLGWVEVGNKIGEIDKQEYFSFRRFVEKPNFKVAQNFHASSKYFWNTGFYVFRASDLLKAFQEFLPTTFDKLKKIQTAIGAKNFNNVLQKEYPLCEKISFDYGVMEKIDLNKVVILPADLGWNDVGTWHALKDELSQEQDNLIKGEVVTVNTSGTLIYGKKKKLIAVAGLKNFIVVDTDDALLICPKEEATQIKKLIEKIREEKKESYL